MLRAGSIDARGGEAGFTLIEIVCVLAIIAMLAAVVLPALPRATSPTKLEAYAIQIATLLRADRDAAIWRHMWVATAVNAVTRSVRSGATGEVLSVPDDVHFEALLAARCNQRVVGTTIDFFASGMSCGGTIRLSSDDVGYDIRVNWLTGGVEVVPASGS
jgi:general secretion pathway protein H